MKGRARRAFTLTEILVVLALVGIVMSLLGSFFGTGRRRSHALDFRVQALQTVHLLRARLAADLAAHVPGPPLAEAIPRASSLRFLRVPQEGGPGEEGLNLDDAGRVLTEAVEWRFDGKTHRVLRNGEAGKVGRFKELFFSWYPRQEDGEEGETVQVHGIIVPDEALRNPDGPSKEEFPMSFSLRCPQTTARRVYDEWIGSF